MGNDDDFTFGDFTFAAASTSSSSNPAAPNCDGEEEDNEWGDFVSPSSKLSNNISSNGTLLFDPLRGLNGSSRSELEVKLGHEVVMTDNRGSKAGGAIPLSIFGEEEHEEEGSVAVAALNNGSQVDVILFKKGSNSNVKTFGVNDSIASFYSTSKEVKSVNALNSGSTASNLSLIVPSKSADVSSLNPNGSSGVVLNGSNFNLDMFSVPGSLGMNSDVKLLSQSNEKTKVENVSTLNSNGLDIWDSDLRVAQLSEEIKTGNESNKVANQYAGNKVESGLASSLNGWNFDLNFSSKVPAKIEESIIQNGVNPNLFVKENGLTLGLFDFDFSLNGSGTHTDKLYHNTNLVNQDKQTKKDDGSNSNPYVSNFNNQMSSVADGWDMNKISAEQVDDDDDGWEFQDAKNWHVDCKVEEGWGFEPLGFGVGTATMKQEIQDGREVLENAKKAESTSMFGSGSHHQTDLFSLSKSSNSVTGFDFLPHAEFQNGYTPDISKSSLKETESNFGSLPVDVNKDFDENMWEFKEASSKTLMKNMEETSTANFFATEVDISNKECENEVHEITPKDQNRALPLSLFSEGTLEVDGSLNNHDTFSFKSTSNQGTEANGLGTSISLTDFISSLYSQAEKPPSDELEKVDLNDAVCTQTMLDLDSSNNNDDFDDSSWEFKVASSEPTAGDQTSAISLGDTFQYNISKFQNNVEFFRELKDELCHVVICHISNMKRSGSSAAFSKEEVEVDNPEAEEAYEVLEEVATMDLEVYLQNQPPRISRVKEFHEVLILPKLRAFDSAYDLRRRVSSVEKDIKAAINLLKDVSQLLKVLSLGSTTDQYNYISTWSTIISVCAEEIKHGALVWKQAVQYNVRCEIITELRGQEFFQSLGEIYRAVQVIGAAANIYKPWILLNSLNPASFFDQLEECFALWKNSGLDEALRSLPDSVHRSLQESIQYLCGLDVMAVRNSILAQEVTVCRLSLLTPDTVPGMKTVTWNDEHYFVTLANLWANLISYDPPKLPHIHVG